MGASGLTTRAEAVPDRGERFEACWRAGGTRAGRLHPRPQAFRRLALAVDRRVLIPRPETELLVEFGLSLPRGARVSTWDRKRGGGAGAEGERPDCRSLGIDIGGRARGGAGERGATRAGRGLRGGRPARGRGRSTPSSRTSPTWRTARRAAAGDLAVRATVGVVRRRRRARRDPAARGDGRGVPLIAIEVGSTGGRGQQALEDAGFGSMRRRATGGDRTGGSRRAMKAMNERLSDER